MSTSKTTVSTTAPARRRAFTCAFASQKTLGASEESHGSRMSAVASSQVTSTAASDVARPTRRGSSPRVDTVTPTSPDVACNHSESAAASGSDGVGASATGAEAAAIAPSTPAASKTRGRRVRNSRRAKMSRTAWASIGRTARSPGTTGSSTSRSRRLSERFRRTSSMWSRRLLPTTPLMVSACARRSSSVPNCVSHLTAVFSPTFGTPGRLSLVSPTSAATSGYCSGGTL